MPFNPFPFFILILLQKASTPNYSEIFLRVKFEFLKKCYFSLKFTDVF